MTYSPSSLGSRRRLVYVTLGVLVGSMVGVPPTQAAVIPIGTSNLEIDDDANLLVDEPEPSVDWVSVDEARFADQPSGPTDNIFTSGNKEDDESPGVTTGSASDKSDLIDLGAYVEATPDTQYVSFYWTRSQSATGSVSVDVEFNQQSCLAAPEQCSANGVTPLRSVGDALLTYDLEQGGTRALIQIRIWQGAAWGRPQDLSAANLAVGTTNQTQIASADADGLGPLAAQTFGEATFDVLALLGTASCQGFQSAVVKTRASPAFTSNLVDLVGPAAVQVGNCGSVTVTKVDDEGAPLEGVEFTLFEDNGDDVFNPPDEDPLATNPDGEPLVCVTGSAGMCTIDDVPIGEYWIEETGGLVGYDKDPNLPQQFVVVGPDPVELQFVNARQLGDIEITKVVDGDAASLVPDGTTYTVDVSCVFEGEQLPTETVTLTTPDGLTGTAGPFRAGAECTISEVGDGGATSVTIDPNPVVIGADETSFVTLTNTYETGLVDVTKVVTGELADLAPDEFTVEVSCTFLGEPIEPPFELVIGPDAPGQIDGLPIGAECSVTETDDGGGSSVVVEPEEFTVGDEVQVTVTNSYDPAGLRVIKEVTGPGAPFVPDGTVFTARVVCESDGEVVLDTTADIVVGEPWQETGLPIGSQCTVTEVEDNGASAVVIDPAGTFELVGDDPVLVEATITNVFDVGDLTVTKLLAGDGASLVPEGTAFVVNVTCDFLGTEVYNEDQTLTWSADATASIPDLPAGASCTVSEIEDAGASAVAISPQEPVEINSGETVVVEVTNTFPLGQLQVEKIVAGDAAELVPEGTEFVVNVTCELQGNEVLSEDISLVWSTAANSVVEVPVGAECTVTETEQSGASSVDISPNPVTIGDAGPITVSVTNEFPTSDLDIVKELAGDAAAFVPEGTEFTVNVTCDFLGGEVLDQDVVLTWSSDVATTIPDLPVNATCLVSEVDSGGATDVSIEPPNAIVITDDGAAGAVVTNTFDTGSLEISKVVDGGLAEIAPDSFTVEVSCEFLGQTIDPVEVTVTVDDPTIVDGLPAGATCTVVETDDGGAGEVSISPSGPYEIGSNESPVAITVTNTFEPGGLGIFKTLAGDGAQFVPDDTVFTATVVCALTQIPELVFAETVEFSVEEPALVSGLPEGASCVVTEVQTNGATSVEVSPNPVIVVGGEVPATVEITNTYDVGNVTVEKTVQGLGAEFATGPFGVRVLCSFLGETVVDTEVALTPPDALSGTVGDVPLGSECSVIETDDGGATAVEVVPSEFTVDGDAPAVVVSVVNTFGAGDLEITKELAGDAAQFVPDDAVFTAQVTCDFEGEQVFADEVDFSVLAPGTVTGLPTGTVCDLAEVVDSGAQSVTSNPDPASVTIGDGDTVTVEFTNTFVADSFNVTKLVDDPSGLVPEGTQYTVEVTCTYPPDFPEPGEIPGFDPLELMLQADELAPVGPLPIGSECTIVETDAAGGQGVVDPGTVTVGDDTTATVEITNTYPVGTAEITKVVDGELANLAPDSFQIEVTCTYPADFPVQGEIPGYDPVALNLGDGDSGTVGPLPVGAECSVVETDDGGATTVEIDQPTFAIDEDDVVEVTVTNTFDPAGLRILKVVDGDGAAFVPDDTVFTADVTCTFEDGSAEFEIDFSVDEPGIQTGLPVGAACTVDEIETNGAASYAVEPSGEFVLEGSDPVQVDVTVTNTFDVGTVQVSKELDGAGAAFVPDGTTYAVDVSCTFLGAPVEGYDPFTATLTTPDQLTQTVGPLPAGAECAVTETDTAGASNSVVDPGSVIVGSGEPVTVTVTNTYGAGSLVIDKVINGPANLVEGSFEFTISCVYQGADLDPQPANVTITPPSTSVTVDGLPVGAECTVAELAPYGGADGPAVVEPGSVVISEIEDAAVTATNTFTEPPDIVVPPPEPPVTPPAQPPTSGLPMTGAALAALGLAAAVLLALGVVLWSWSRRGRAPQYR